MTRNDYRFLTINNYSADADEYAENVYLLMENTSAEPIEITIYPIDLIRTVSPIAIEAPEHEACRAPTMQYINGRVYTDPGDTECMENNRQKQSIPHPPETHTAISLDNHKLNKYVVQPGEQIPAWLTIFRKKVVGGISESLDGKISFDGVIESKEMNISIPFTIHLDVSSPVPMEQGN